MGKLVLMKGNEALSEAAIIAGCRYYFGYPITPQNEVTAYMARRLKEMNGVFIQAESEVAAINMVYGASAAGARAMTSSSSPGISLKMEGLSYLAGSRLPCVVANVMRAGPGLGNITPSQGDYFQATKGGGHGDYHVICLAPHSVQDTADYTVLAFDLADKYRVPVMILSDGMIGQMLENIILPENKPDSKLLKKDWALKGAKNRERNVIRSLWLYPADAVEKNNILLQETYKQITANEIRFEEYMLNDAEVIFTAFGISARICKGTIDVLRKQGIRCGLFRPITLWPFPYKKLEEYTNSARVKFFMDIELNAGQMLEDVNLAVKDKKPVYFYGRFGGYYPSIEEIITQVKSRLK